MEEDVDAAAPLEPPMGLGLPPLITTMDRQASVSDYNAAFVVYDGGHEVDLSPVVRTPTSVFDAGKWY